ncbi:HEAT repeat domain-containing protein [Pirellulaceae bacterium SH501]
MMSNTEQAILDRLNADNWAVLYRCRWSKLEAEQVVPQLETLLDSEDRKIRDDALRALFHIGTPAVSAASRVASLIESQEPITRQLAVLTLGQIAFKVPDLCVEPLASFLSEVPELAWRLSRFGPVQGRPEAPRQSIDRPHAEDPEREREAEEHIPRPGHS